MTDTPTIWKDMTDAEKGALLLAKHEGRKIQVCNPMHAPSNRPHMLSWSTTNMSVLRDNLAYRKAPEPKLETVLVLRTYAVEGFTACVAINMLDGEPLWDTLRKWEGDE